MVARTTFKVPPVTQHLFLYLRLKYRQGQPAPFHCFFILERDAGPKQSPDVFQQMIAANIELQVSREDSGLTKDAAQESIPKIRIATEWSVEGQSRIQPVNDPTRNGVWMPAIAVNPPIACHPGLGDRVKNAKAPFVRTRPGGHQQIANIIEVVEMVPPKLA